MMGAPKQYYICILDRSRSIYGREREWMTLYNRWLAALKKEPGEIYVTTALFCEDCEFLYLHMPVEHVKELDSFTYYVRGSTALYDSTARILAEVDNDLDNRLDGVGEQKTILLFSDLTDNASISHTQKDMEQLFAEKERKGWRIRITV